MRMHNPPHPGEIFRKLCLEPLGLNVTEVAKALVPRPINSVRDFGNLSFFNGQGI